MLSIRPAHMVTRQLTMHARTCKHFYYNDTFQATTVSLILLIVYPTCRYNVGLECVNVESLVYECWVFTLELCQVSAHMVPVIAAGEAYAILKRVKPVDGRHELPRIACSATC